MKRFGEEEIEAVIAVIRNGELSSFYKNFLGGDRVKEFEREFAEYIGATYAVSFSSGTATLHSALLACGVQKGSVVYTTPYTFVSTGSAILMAGGRPCFIDVDPLTYNINVNQLKKVLERTTRKNKQNVILPVDLLGHPCEIEEIMNLANTHNCLVVEDAAQAVGSEYNTYRCGSQAHVGCFSLQATKTLTSGGEGGMAVTDDPELAKKLRNYRNHGEKYAVPESDDIGYNYRLSEMQAAFGLVQLHKLEPMLHRQILLAEYLCSLLPKKHITPPFVAKYVTRHSYFLIGAKYVSKNISREQFLEELKMRKVSQGKPGQNVSEGYNKLLYQHKAFRNHFYSFGQTYSVANKLLEKALWIDLHRFGQTPEKIREYIEIFKQILESNPKKKQKYLSV